MENEQIILNDVYFKCLFGDEKNKMCLCCLLSEIMKEDYKYIYDNIIYINKDLGKINIKDTSSYVDVLVDGPFILEKKDLSLRFRGSSNQRIIDVPASLEKGEVILWQDWQGNGRGLK